MYAVASAWLARALPPAPVVVARNPRASQRVHAQRLLARRGLFRSTQERAGDGLAVEHPAQGDKRIVRGHAVRVGARTDIHADPERGLERGRAAGGLGALFLLETMAVEVHS